MEWDTTTVALVVSSLVTLVGILPQVVQSLTFSKSDSRRAENEALNAKSQEMIQFSGATQTITNASAVLINDLQEEAQVLRQRNIELRERSEHAENAMLNEHLVGKRLLADLALLRSKHLEEYSKEPKCPFGVVLDNRLKAIIAKYETTFSNGVDLSGYEEKPKEEPQQPGVSNG
jgi:hypothetical protein